MFCFFLDVLYLCSKNIMPMRKIAVTFFILVTYFCQANPIDVAKARQVAMDFFENRIQSNSISRSRVISVPQLELAYTHYGEAGNASYYVFNQSQNQGFVIVSADDRSTPILGYAGKGSFDMNKLPNGLKDLLMSYGKQISCAATNNIGNTRASKKLTDIEPLIQTQWDQHEPYNNMCPIDPNTGKRSLTGCGATALAQLLYFHQYPNTGKNSISYEWNGTTYSADFAKVNFEWDKMRLAYDEGTPDEDNAVATLMYYCALSMKSEFTSDNTNSWFDTEFLSTYFGYKNEIKLLWKKDTSDDEFESVIIQDLQKGLPVYCWAEASADWSHIFLIDGCDTNGFFHMNFGWSGEYDGYYLLSPIDLGWKNMNSFQCILYNIQPDIPGKWFLRTNDDRFFEMSNVESLEAASDNDTYYNIYDSSGELLASKVSSVSFVYTTGTNPELCPKGDANCDGRVNTADIVETINAVRGNPSMRFIEFNADANSDGKIDSKDIEAIKNIILTSESATEN